MSIFEYIFNFDIQSYFLDHSLLKWSDIWYDIKMFLFSSYFIISVIFASILLLMYQKLPIASLICFFIEKLYWHFNVTFMHIGLGNDSAEVYNSTMQNELILISSLSLMFIWYYSSVHLKDCIFPTICNYIIICMFNFYFVSDSDDMLINCIIVLIVLILSIKLKTFGFIALFLSNILLKILYILSEYNFDIKIIASCIGLDVIFWILLGIPLYKCMKYNSKMIKYNANNSTGNT